MSRKNKGAAPVGDAMHSPKVKQGVQPDRNGNRAERRAADKANKKKR